MRRDRKFVLKLISWRSSRKILFLIYLAIAVRTPAIAAPMQEQSFRTTDDISLTYLSAGSGDIDLIFIPGWLMPADVFRKQFLHFSKIYRVHVLNPRSQGGSDIYLGTDLAEARARDIQEFIKHLGTRQFILIAWSLGVMESLDYLHRYGQRGLLGLVLIDNSIGEGTPPAVRSSSKGREDKKNQKKMTPEQFNKYIRRFATNMFDIPPDPEMFAAIERSALKLAFDPQQAFRVLQKPYPRSYYRETVYEVRRPVFYAVTRRFAEQSDLFSRRHPFGVTKIYDNAGHALFVDAATEFNDDLEEFIRLCNSSVKKTED